MQQRPKPVPVESPSLALRLFRPLARFWFWITGFSVEGRFPDLPKFVIIAAPHTTNWDLPHALAAGMHYGKRVHWMGKNSIFKPPFGGLMRWLGGIGVDRSKSANAVQGMIDIFATRDELALIIAPAGTRSATIAWKSGFYHIAYGAKVPIVCAFIDYKRKAIGIAGMIEPVGNYEADMLKIRALYDAAAANPVP